MKFREDTHEITHNFANMSAAAFWRFPPDIARHATTSTARKLSL
jgi:hypothetical protein